MSEMLQRARMAAENQMFEAAIAFALIRLVELLEGSDEDAVDRP